MGLSDQRPGSARPAAGAEIHWRCSEVELKSKRRRTKITIETRRLVMTGPSRKAWCAGCDQEVEMISIDEAVAQARMSALQIYRNIDAGKLHYTETEEGSLLVCVESIGRLI